MADIEILGNRKVEASFDIRTCIRFLHCSSHQHTMHDECTPTPNWGRIPCANLAISHPPNSLPRPKFHACIHSCPTPLYAPWPEFHSKKNYALGKIYELEGRERGGMTPVEWMVAAISGVRLTFAASAKRVVQQPSTTFCIQLLSSLTKTICFPSDLYVPNLAGSNATPTDGEIEVAS